MLQSRNPSRWHGCRFSSLMWNGQRVLYLENEVLRIGINVDKGAEIFEFRYKPADVDAMWHRDCASPQNLSSSAVPASGADAFFDRYIGGWQESFPVGNSAGLFDRAQMSLHGEVSLLPWQFYVLEDAPGRVEIEFSVECVRTPFQLKRRMSIESGIPGVLLDETILNTGRVAVPFV